MSRLKQYEAGALAAWTPASQAALNATHHDKQLEHDQLPALEALKEEETKARDEVKTALRRAERKGDKKEIAKLKEETKKLDEIWGPKVDRWDFERDEQYKLKKKDRRVKEKRAVTYETAEAVSAGKVVDNLVCWLFDQTMKRLVLSFGLDQVVEPSVICFSRHPRSTPHYHHPLGRWTYLLLVSPILALSRLVCECLS